MVAEGGAINVERLWPRVVSPNKESIHPTAHWEIFAFRDGWNWFGLLNRLSMLTPLLTGDISSENPAACSALVATHSIPVANYKAVHDIRVAVEMKSWVASLLSIQRPAVSMRGIHVQCWGQVRGLTHFLNDKEILIPGIWLEKLRNLSCSSSLSIGVAPLSRLWSQVLLTITAGILLAPVQVCIQLKLHAVRLLVAF